MRLILWLRERIGTATITPNEAAQCREALQRLHDDVHARFDALPTPGELEAQCRREGIIR